MREPSLEDILPITYRVTAANDLESAVIKEKLLFIWATASEMDVAHLTSVIQSARRPQIGDDIIVMAKGGMEEPVYNRLTAVVSGELKLSDLGMR